ncbi:MAG: hypothetical protein ACREH4_11075 [Vitreimonas sp.]
MNDKELRRALAAPPPETDNVSDRVRRTMRTTRLRQGWLRWAAVLAVGAATAAALRYGYVLAAAALPPVGDSGAALVLWLPVGVAAALIVITAALALAAIGRSR